MWKGSQGTMISIHRQMTLQEGRSQSVLPVCLAPSTLSKSTICLSAFIKLELANSAYKSTLVLEPMVLQMHLIRLLPKLFALIKHLKTVIIVSTATVPVQFG